VSKTHVNHFVILACRWFSHAGRFIAGEKSNGENSKKNARGQALQLARCAIFSGSYFRGQVLQYYLYILHFAATLKLLNYPTEVFENVALQDLTLFFLGNLK
jgi:hypothetical protein